MKLLMWASRKSAIPHAEVPMPNGEMRRVPIFSFKELDQDHLRHICFLIELKRKPVGTVKPAVQITAKEVFNPPAEFVASARLYEFVRRLRQHE